MCQIIEKITIQDDGRRHKSQDTYPCSKAPRQGVLCQNVKTKKTEYYPNAHSTSSRGESPSSNGPFTPPTVGGPGYTTEIHRPSSSRGAGARRPSIKPEIVIEIGGRKSNTKFYPKGPRSSQRSSLASTHSNEAVLDSPGSDKIVTGFPEASLPPTGYTSHPDGYNYRHAVPHGHRQTSSSSSHSASRVPSLTSEPESPTTRRTARYPPALVHNPIPAAPPSPATSRAHAPTSAFSSRGNYRTETVAPPFPVDYDDFLPRPPASSRASSGVDDAPEITARAQYREERRRAEKIKRQEEDDRRMAEELHNKEFEKEEKTVRFADERHQSRSEQQYRTQIREETRQKLEGKPRKEEKISRKEGEKQATKRPERPKTKPPAGFDNPSRRHRRRSSVTMTPEEKKQLERLRREEINQQEREREASDRWDREEQLSLQNPYATAPPPPQTLLQQQETVEYYNPRSSGPTMSRQPSVSRRGSVSISQPVPPQQTYPTRQPSSHYPSGSYNTSSANRPVSARHSSYHHDNPFAQPPTRTSNTSQDSTNPFAAPSTRPIHPSSSDHAFSPTTSDPWDARSLHSSLPSTSTTGGYPRQNALQMMGEQVIHRSGDRSAHRRAQAATQNMGRAINHDNSALDSSSDDDEVEHARTARLGKTLGMGKGKRRS
ncbi:hypothetical protein DM02DRAFT_633633 [Periconia macrospinosa]|uniref:Uncharacterized protein n=1 Tax=Periconia macrospinosa TaxID=97972 RepID=A0A2V1DBG8_9PLEO|nr:hypothetical protein DM02DRAFT_633633 [Periconia macrospinosa]